MASKSPDRSLTNDGGPVCNYAVMITEEKVERTEDRTSERKQRPLPITLQALARLAWNYWWSWSEDAAIFRDLDPDAWEECEHNPRRLLNEVSDFRLMQMATDPGYVARVRALAEKFDRYMERRGAWSPRRAREITAAHPVAYFCAEYGLHNSLPIYSGGLGILAGDHLKSASDLGLPLVAVGLLYRYGYFRQRIRRDGWQEEHYGELQPDLLPVFPVLDENGAPVAVEVLIRGRTVRARAWRVQVGRVALLLLDSNLKENDPTDRWITGHLYGGDRETRVVQEMLLGIGGIRLLRQLKIEPRVYHLNEGHSAFLTLELAREFIVQGSNFADAVERVRRLCVFTTHTPIAAGNDEFDPALIERCFGEVYWRELGLTREEFIALGRVHPTRDDEPFGMTPLAIRMSRSTNGVSRKHGEVSRALWRELWPDVPTERIPIAHVTNGVHAPTWVAPLIRAIYEKRVGKSWTEIMLDQKRWARAIEKIADEELWEAHSLLKQQLVAFIRHRSHYAWLQRGESPERVDAARTLLDPEALIIGFARRVAGYKRWSLLLTDPERLLRLIDDAERPVQFVFAGKAHPQDMEAKLVLQRIAQWRADPRIMRRAIFLQDYDQEIARQLVQGVDVWLNVPRPPLEASGTSGQKVAMNGGLNLSVLDGWWIEGFDGTNGWAIGDPTIMHASLEDDARHAEALYRLLEDEVVPLYYERDADGIPRRWVAMMKRAIATLAPKFNSDRMVRDYTREIYLAKRNRP